MSFILLQLLLYCSKNEDMIARAKKIYRCNYRRSGFGGDGPPVEMTAKMFEVEWEFANGYCSPKPKSLKPISTIQNVRLIPYGCTNLRMTEIPYIKTADAD